jgi:dTDP-4-amino-4,6-dideoxygalactose transaminase
LRNHGYRPKYYNKVVGGNFRLDAIQAAVLRVKLKHLDRWTEERQQNATVYRRLFAEAGLVNGAANSEAAPSENRPVILPVELDDKRHIYNQFVIRCHRRDALKDYLKQQGIGTEIYYPVSLHLQECFSDLGYQPGDLPVSEGAADQTLALPIYAELTEAMQTTVVEAVSHFYGEK